MLLPASKVQRWNLRPWQERIEKEWKQKHLRNICRQTREIWQKNPWPTHVENTCKKKQLKHAKPYKTFHEILVGFRLNTIVNYLGSIIPYINSKASLFVTYIHNLDLNPLSWCHETVLRTLKMGTIRTSELLLPGGHIKSLGCLESYHFPKTSS